MSFRARLTLVAAAAVALAVVAASAVAYVVVRDQLTGQVDDALRQRAGFITHDPRGPHLEPGPGGKLYLDVPGPPFGGSAEYVQALFRGKAYRSYGEPVPLPVDARVRDVANRKRGAFFSDERVHGTDLRVLTFPYGAAALQVARSTAEMQRTLGRLKLWLLLIAGGGVALAAGLGLVVSRAALAPVRRLTSTTEKVTETRDLGERIDVEGRDELSRLAASFNTMLGALDESIQAQRQLVADASHELRTPLTSLRTNIEVLASERELPPGERQRLLRDVVEQLSEMTTLVAELVELARGEQQAAEPEDVRLDLVTADAVGRAQRDRPGVSFDTDLHESLVRGVPSNLERAVANLLDNAAKWSPPGGAVEVAVRGGEVTVRDHGPGIDEEDLPYVFDRFYRARSARGMSGSGLGLSIVRQVAETHGGQVVAERPEGGGTLMRLRLDGVLETS
jgi:two-component system, OmpR family, sensor histidine kinase MprB